VVLAILLGTAAMVAGLIAWRAAGHSGEAQKEFALSTQAANNANSLQQDTSQEVINERNLFIAYENAVALHDPVLTADALGLMDAPTVRTFNWWLNQTATSRPTSPVASANPRRPHPGRSSMHAPRLTSRPTRSRRPKVRFTGRTTWSCSRHC